MAEQVVAKAWYWSKTIWANVLGGAVLVVSSTEFMNVVPSTWVEEIALAIVVMNLILRGITSGSITVSEEGARLKNAAVLFLCASLAFLPACSLRSGKSVERTVAIYGLQALQGMESANATAKELHGLKVITNEQYKVYLENSRKAFVAARTLAEALEAYDKAATEDAASKVRGALDALAVVVPGVTLGLTGEAGTKIVATIAEVNKLIVTIAQAVRPPVARPAPPAALERVNPAAIAAAAAL